MTSSVKPGTTFITRKTSVENGRLGSGLTDAYVPGSEAEMVPTAFQLAQIAVSLSDETGLCPEFFLVESDPTHQEALKEVARLRAEAAVLVGATAVGSI
jgi:hypothetical protein